MSASFEHNPLYQPPAFPDFANLKPEHANAVLRILEENRAEISKLETLENPNFENFVMPLERMENRLNKAFSPIAHLHHVMSTDAWREAYQSLLPALSEYGTDYSQNQKIYQQFIRVRDDKDFEKLPKSRQKLVHDSIDAFERNGVGLDAQSKEAFKQSALRLSELSNQFGNQLLDATNAWSLLITDEEELIGVPETSKALFRSLAEQAQQEGYRLTLDAPVVTPILTYAKNRDLREKVFRAYQARASELADNGKFDNTPVLQEMMKIRLEQSKMLGAPDYASRSVAPKMAKTPAAVLALLWDLVAKSKASAEADMKNLRAFAQSALGIDKLEAWDMAFVSEAYKQQKFSFSQEDLRPYFPVSAVLEGMFGIVHDVFGVSVKPSKALSVWHQDVLAYDVFENDKLIAHFYLDLYARAQKRGGAWMDGAVSRMQDGDALQLPVTYLVCNFTPPVGKEESCLTHYEVQTLFHEFGHGLHHMLTKVVDYSQAGINGVEWDAVEQPSQFMENFCDKREGLNRITRHIKTGETLPEDLFQKLQASKHELSALALLRQMELSLFDFIFHMGNNALRPALEVLAEVKAQVSVVPNSDSRLPMQFSHLFAGGYAAGYYSYIWAEVLSADSFGAFEETGVFNPETGKRFKEEILSVGSTRPSMDSFVAFRGRRPNVDALLRHKGIAA
ncbi:MAG: M3 family metallopeptidase [Cardiobacteriaceae bacterium]|nr:M3 family metallopeptidase [Cardiobacteriaceae bacterium]